MSDRFIIRICILGLVASLIILGYRCKAQAAERGPQFGGCILTVSPTECRLEAGPSVAVTVGKYESGKFSAGVLPGVGYGLTLYPQRWYSLGLAGYGQLSVGGAAPSSGTLSVLMSFAEYVRLGVGRTFLEGGGGSTALLFGLGLDFGGSSSYVREVGR
jgi:hypothetical protein